jgi:integrase
MTAKKERTSVPGVYKRGETYLVAYRYRGRQKWLTAKTLNDARRLKRQAEADVDRGEHRAGSTTTFGAYARDWLDTYAGRTSRGLSDTTRADYRRSIETYAISHFDVDRRLQLTEIEPPDIRRFIATLEATGLAPSSVSKNLAPLRALFATAVEDGALRSNPTVGVRINRRRGEDAEEPEAKALTTLELAALLGTLPDRWRLFFELLAHSGLRISEALGLDRGDIEFGAQPRLHVRRQFYRGKLKRLKTSNGRRALPLSPAMARALWPICQGPDAPLFATGTGGRLSDRNVRRVLDHAADQAGVPWASFHTFRHTCASMLFEHGKNIRQVATWLGHSDPAFTLRTYVHLMDNGLGTVDFLDQHMPPAPPMPTNLPTHPTELHRTTATG